MTGDDSTTELLLPVAWQSIDDAWSRISGLG